MVAAPLVQGIRQIGSVHVLGVVPNVYGKALHKVAVILEREGGVVVVQAHVNPSNHQLIFQGLELEVFCQGKVSNGVGKVLDSAGSL